MLAVWKHRDNKVLSVSVFASSGAILPCLPVSEGWHGAVRVGAAPLAALMALIPIPCRRCPGH
jgi:hypothetical protein